MHVLHNTEIKTYGQHGREAELGGSGDGMEAAQDLSRRSPFVLPS